MKRAAPWRARTFRTRRERTSKERAATARSPSPMYGAACCIAPCLGHETSDGIGGHLARKSDLVSQPFVTAALAAVEVKRQGGEMPPNVVRLRSTTDTRPLPLYPDYALQSGELRSSSWTRSGTSEFTRIHELSGRGWSQRAIAAALGVSRGAVYHQLRARREARAEAEAGASTAAGLLMLGALLLVGWREWTQSQRRRAAAPSRRPDGAAGGDPPNAESA